MQTDIRTGPIVSADGAVNPARSDNQGSKVTTAAHGEYNEAVARGRIFIAANQAAVTTTAAGGLDVTQLGICVSNPPGSGYDLSILKVSWAWTDMAGAAISSVHLAGGWVVTGGVTAHTTPLVVYSALIGSGATSIAYADAATTIVGPYYLLPLIGGFTATALFAQPMAVTDLGGSVIVPPGGYVFIATLTEAVGFGAIIWEEVAE